MLNRLSYYIDKLRSDGKIDYDVYLNLREMSDQLGDENAALRERLEKAILNKCVYYINSVWNDATMTRKKEVCCGVVDYACYKFIEIKGITLSWNEIYFTYEAAEARLAEMKEELSNTI